MQQATESSTTEAATVAAESNTANRTHFNNNNNNNLQHKGQQQSNVKGNPEALYEHFEFNIDLLTEHSRVEGKQQTTQTQEQQFTAASSDDQKQLFLSSSLSPIDFDTESSDKLIEEILFSINSNNNNNKNNINNINNINSNNSCSMLSSTSSNNNNNNINNMAVNSGLEQPLKGEPNIFEFFEEISTVCNDDLHNTANSNGPFSLDGMEDAIDITSMGDYSLNDCFINTQPNDIMFGGEGCYSESTPSQSLSQQYPKVQELSQEIMQAEPFVPLDDEQLNYTNTIYSPVDSAVNNSEQALSFLSSSACQMMVDLNENATAYDMDAMAARSSQSSYISTVNSLKRVHSSQTQGHMAEKRSKLRLEIKRQSPEVAAVVAADTLNTPAVIKLILDNDQVSYL